CLIQGILVASLCQQIKSQDISITESHPKALLWLLGRATRDRRPGDIDLSDLREFVKGGKIASANDHERDAVLGAVTAYAMESRLSGWQNLYPRETNPFTSLDP